MSTLAEHVVNVEFYQANYDERQKMRDALAIELWLVATTHLKEICAMCSRGDVAAERLRLAEQMRNLYGSAAEPFIARWHAAIPASKAAEDAQAPAEKLNPPLPRDLLHKDDGITRVGQEAPAAKGVSEDVVHTSIDKALKGLVITGHKWLNSANYGGELCAHCGVPKGSRRALAHCSGTHDAASESGVSEPVEGYKAIYANGVIEVVQCEGELDPDWQETRGAYTLWPLYSRKVSEPVDEQADLIQVFRLMKKVDGVWTPASEYFAGLPEQSWEKLVAENPDEWKIQRRVTGRQIAEGREPFCIVTNEKHLGPERWIVRRDSRGLLEPIGGPFPVTESERATIDGEAL